MESHEQVTLISGVAVRKRLGINSRQHLHSLVKAGSFPAPVKIGGASARWIESEVEQWLAARVAERNARLAKGEQPVDGEEVGGAA